MFDFAYVDNITLNTTQLATTEMLLKDGVQLDYETYSAHLLIWTVTVGKDVLRKSVANYRLNIAG